MNTTTFFMTVGLARRLLENADVPADSQAKIQEVRIKVDTLVRLEHEETELLQRLKAALLKRGSAP